LEIWRSRVPNVRLQQAIPTSLPKRVAAQPVRAASADLPSTHRQPSSILSATAQNFFFALCHRRRAKKAHGRQKLGLTKLRVLEDWPRWRKKALGGEPTFGPH
jgi:hypothetical protein